MTPLTDKLVIMKLIVINLHYWILTLTDLKTLYLGSTGLFLNTLKISAKRCIFNFALVKILTFGMLVIDYLTSALNISTNVRLFI